MNPYLCLLMIAPAIVWILAVQIFQSLYSRVICSLCLGISYYWVSTQETLDIPNIPW